MKQGLLFSIIIRSITKYFQQILFLDVAVNKASSADGPLPERSVTPCYEHYTALHPVACQQSSAQWSEQESIDMIEQEQSPTNIYEYTKHNFCSV